MTIDFEFNGTTKRLTLPDLHPVVSFEITLAIEATILF